MGGDLRRQFTTDEAIDQLVNIYYEGACNNLTHCKEIALVPTPEPTPAPMLEPTPEPAHVPDALCEAAKARVAGQYSCGERLAYLTSAGSQSLNEGIDQLVNLEFPTDCGDDLLFCRSPPPEAEAVALCSAAKLQAAGSHTCGHVLGDLRRQFSTDEAIDQLVDIYYEGACNDLVHCKEIALVPTAEPTPAPSPQPAPSPAKRQCCGMWACNPNSPEYDPATEQCCGEGENIFAPRVCSKDSGCCPGMYSAPPQCFDRGSQQCCGVNQLSEMPVVCSLDAGCPPESYSWRECPAAGAAATDTNSSSNELLLP